LKAKSEINVVNPQICKKLPAVFWQNLLTMYLRKYNLLSEYRIPLKINVEAIRKAT
jgi:hypothetical protein